MLIRKINAVYSFFLFSILIQNVNLYRILVVSPTSAKSHWLIGSSIAKTLAGAGHDVTVISEHPLEKPLKNYHDVSIAGISEVFKSKFLFEESRKFYFLLIKIFNRLDQSKLKSAFDMYKFPNVVVLPFLFRYGIQVAEMTIQHPNVVKLMESNQKFDAIIVESFCVDSLIGFGQYYNAPVISAATFGASQWTNGLTGNPSPLSYIPHFLLRYTDKMTFFERLNNGLMQIYENLVMEFYYKPNNERIYNTYFPNPKPTFDIVYKKGVSLVFLNSHFSLSFPKPFLPNVIETGGIHITVSNKTLPKVSNFRIIFTSNYQIYNFTGYSRIS